MCSLEPSAQGVMSIGRNLNSALRHLRYRSKTRRLWIDALCINQNNTDERSKQVSIMNKVYSTAERVVSWLGKEQDGCEKAIALLQKIYQAVEADPFTQIVRPITDDPDGWADRDTPVKWTHDQMNGVYALLDRPYFERAWIQQEILLATDILFQCGHAMLTEQGMWRSATCLFGKLPYDNVLSPITLADWDRIVTRAMELGTRRLARRMSQADHEKVSLIGIRPNSHALRCSDPRDKTYALLGLMNQRDTDLHILPDYSRNVAEVYMDITRMKSIAHQTLELLWSCELSTRVLDIPSWVPDWSTPMKRKSYPRFNWSVCGFISAQFAFAGERCTASGIRVAEVSAVYGHSLKTFDTFGDSGYTLDFLDAIEPSSKVLSRPYKNGQSLYEAYCRTLTRNKLSDTEACEAGFHDTKRCLSGFEEYWKTNSLARIDSSGVLDRMSTELEGNDSVQTDCGYIGLAPAGTQIGDIVSILLGCHQPIMLRPNDSTDRCERTYSVVGACYVHGIMNGEAIYQDVDPLRYNAIGQDENRPGTVHIDEYCGLLHDSKANTFTDDPTKPLKEAGIKVESFVREPHRLIVLPKALRAVSIAVESLVLV